MPIVTRVLATLASEPSGTAFNVPLNATPDAGEYLQVLISHSYDAGWSAAVTDYALAGDTAAVRTTYMPYARLFTKFAAGNEASIPCTKGSSTASFAIIVLGSTGVDPNSPLAGGPTFAAGGQASGTSPSVTPAAAGVEIWAVAHQNYRAAADSDIAWTGGGEIAQAVSTFNIASLASDVSAAGVASGTKAWSVSPWSGNTPASVAVWALREAPVATGPEPGRMLLAA